jgi:hypothetical protein
VTKVRNREEDQLVEAIIDMCRLFGLYVAHFRPAQIRPGRWVTAVQGDGKGYPDLTIVGPGGAMWREAKSSTGSMTPEQKIWASRIKAGGGDFAVWKPADLHSGRIEAELRALRTRVAI